LVGVIHPFPNGNGRHARLHADVIAVKLERPEFTWGQNSIVGTGPTREAYIRALQAADHGNIQELLKFARSYRRSYVGAPCTNGNNRVISKRLPVAHKLEEFCLHFTKYALPCCTERSWERILQHQSSDSHGMPRLEWEAT
jgi:hypothetical protein